MGLDRERQNEDRLFNEETAVEIIPRVQTNPSRREDLKGVNGLTNTSLAPVQEGANGSALGVTGLMLSIASLFLLPFLLSLFGIGAGLFAYKRGATGFGRWAIGIGVVSFISSMIFAPFLG
ncbi:MAG TPA: DUF4190 domain-containing protein [Bacillota bacterium]|nr:DUF4190 domain-containing protein [Bacillota bacterium]